MTTCYTCAKLIKGKIVRTSPPIINVQLGIDFPKTYHPKCYEKAEREAAKQLGREYVQPA